MRSLGALLYATLAALTVLLASIAADRTHYFCKMMGEAVAECCCPGQHEPAETVALRAPDCCERLVSAKRAVAATSVDATIDVGPPVCVALAPLVEAPTVDYRLHHARPATARAPPALGPPLFLSHCSLLI